MTPRPRETSDEEILAAAARVMQRRSPVELTLADIAQEAGVVPATIIQRFGTKRELLLANCKAWTGNVAGQFVLARAKYGSPLKTLIEVFVECSAFAATPESLANSLAYLQIDLTDPEFHALLLQQYRTMRDETRKLLEDAVEERELRPCDTTELANLMLQVNGGAMLDWAVYRQGPLAAWLRRSFEALLRPFLPVRRGRAKKKHPRKSRARPS